MLICLGISSSSPKSAAAAVGTSVGALSSSSVEDAGRMPDKISRMLFASSLCRSIVLMSFTGILSSGILISGAFSSGSADICGIAGA